MNFLSKGSRLAQRPSQNVSLVALGRAQPELLLLLLLLPLLVAVLVSVLVSVSAAVAAAVVVAVAVAVAGAVIILMGGRSGTEATLCFSR